MFPEVTVQFLMTDCSLENWGHRMVYLQVLSGDVQAAEVLAVEVHRDLGVEEIDTDNLPQFTLPLEQCGMWIDPIGMTYILHSALCHISI